MLLTRGIVQRFSDSYLLQTSKSTSKRHLNYGAILSTNISSISTNSDKSLPANGKSEPSEQKYPLYPSVARLLYQQNIPLSEVSRIKATGPRGRLLKGDVLAYIGSVQGAYASEQARRITRLGQLNLGDVRIADVSSSKPSSQDIPASHEHVPMARSMPQEYSVAISLQPAMSVLEKLRNTLGISMTTTALIARATIMANRNLPKNQETTWSNDDLFEAILAPSSTTVERNMMLQGRFVPRMIPPTADSRVTMRERRDRTPQDSDIYDCLTSTCLPQALATNSQRRSYSQTDDMHANTQTKFAVKVDEKQADLARLFLDRLKKLLESQPGSLVL